MSYLEELTEFYKTDQGGGIYAEMIEVACATVDRLRGEMRSGFVHLEQLRLSVNRSCSCGGKALDDGCCPACEVWHRLGLSDIVTTEKDLDWMDDDDGKKLSGFLARMRQEGYEESGDGGEMPGYEYQFHGPLQYRRAKGCKA